MSREGGSLKARTSETPGARARPLRVGVILDSFACPRWVAKVVSEVGDADFLELALVVIAPRGASRRSFPARLKTRASRGLFSLYKALDYRMFQAANDAFSTVDVSESFEGVKTIRAPGSSEEDLADAFAAIQAERLDVILRLGSAPVRPELLECAGYGVWSFLHGDVRAYFRDPPLFWEIFDGSPVSGSVLLAFTESVDDPHVIYRSYSTTDEISLYRNRNAVYWKTANFALRRLRDVHQRGWDYVRSLPTYEEPVNYEASPAPSPSNPEMARFLFRVGRRIARRKADTWLSYERWFVAYRPKREVPPSDMTGFTFIASDPGRFFVDPFLFEHDRKHYVFFEDYELRTKKGVISYLEILPDGTTSQPSVVLEQGYHLSYPFTFVWNDQIYMIPETSGNRTIELYRAVEFPTKWTLERVLMDDIVAVDATLLLQPERIWLFANFAVDGSRIADELFLFWSDSLFGAWTPHPMNPVVSDVRSARPAGNIFVRDGDLIRPSQDSSHGYGSAVVFNRIDALDESDYREVEIARIRPDWVRGNLGSHTYNLDGSYEVVDGRRLDRKTGSLRSPRHLLRSTAVAS